MNLPAEGKSTSPQPSKPGQTVGAASVPPPIFIVIEPGGPGFGDVILKAKSGFAKIGIGSCLPMPFWKRGGCSMSWMKSVTDPFLPQSSLAVAFPTLRLPSVTLTRTWLTPP